MTMFIHTIKTPADLLTFIFENLPHGVDDRWKFYAAIQRNFSLCASNPDLIEWAMAMAKKNPQKLYLMLSGKHICANPNAAAIRLVFGGMSQHEWIDTNDREVVPHYFWLGMNPHTKAYPLIEQRLGMNVLDPLDVGLTVWLSTMCRNPNPDVVALVIKKMETTPESKLIFDYYTHAEYNDQINVGRLAANPAAAEYIISTGWLLSEDPLRKKLWGPFSMNPSPAALNYMCKHPSKVSQMWMCSNSNPRAIWFLQSRFPYPHRWDWQRLSANPSAMDLIARYPKRIHLHSLCKNSHSTALRMIAIEYLRGPLSISFKNLFKWNHAAYSA